MQIKTHQIQSSLYVKHTYIDQSTNDIFRLIASQKWHRLKATVFMHKSAVATCHGQCSSSCKSYHSALHYACRFCPPLDVIRCLYKAYPKGIFEKDCKQRYALHIACKHGCSSEVISFLLKKNPDAANKADFKCRTPFLLAFKSYVFRSDLEWTTANKELIKVAQTLLAAAPLSPIMEDSNGITAIEYAIMNENDISSIKYVQCVCLNIKREIMKYVVAL